MKAARIYTFGDSSKIKLDEAQIPSIKANEVLVKIHEAGVNPVDWKIREGQHGMSGKLPLTLGQDFSGEIMQVGAHIRDFQRGDLVFGDSSGAYAEFIAVSADKIALIPDGLDYRTAAALPTPGLTAWQALFDKGGLEKGQRVLIHGGSGAVGSLAVQLAKWKGAKVITTCSTEELGYVKTLGADQVIDYKMQQFDQMVKDVDLVVDTVGGGTLKKSMKVLRPGGNLVSLLGPMPDKNDAYAISVNVQIMHMQFDADQLAQIADLTAKGLLTIRLGESFHLKNAAQAQDLVKKGHTQGKVLIHVT